MVVENERYRELLLQLSFNGLDDVNVQRFGTGRKTFDDLAVFRDQKLLKVPADIALLGSVRFEILVERRLPVAS